MKFCRSRPWRPRASFASRTAGARRRGHRQDHDGETGSLPAVERDDVVIQIESGIALEGAARVAVRTAAIATQIARIDESGLLAIRRPAAPDTRKDDVRSRPVSLVPSGFGRRSA